VGGPEQIADFNPGIRPSGLFWTTALPASTFDAAPSKGTARFKVEDLRIPDFHDFGNSVSRNPTWVWAQVSFEVTWTGGGIRAKFRDDTFDYGGEFVTGDATISFTASDDGGGTVYTSDEAGQFTALPAGVGHDRNGVFFH